VLCDKYTCKQEECKVCVSDNVLPVGVLDASGEISYSPRLVKCLSMTKGFCWMKECDKGLVLDEGVLMLAHR
jgi:hypothetical protein